MAGAQFWVHDSLGSSYVPSAPLPPQPGAPAYIPVVPVQPGYIPPQGQPAYIPAPGQPGFVPVGTAPGQPGYNPHPHQPAFTNYPKKSSAVISLPAKILYVTLIAVFLAL